MFDKKKNAAESYGVIGLGRFGTALVKTLAAAGKEAVSYTHLDVYKRQMPMDATPRPPICIKIAMTACPNRLNV